MLSKKYKVDKKSIIGKKIGSIALYLSKRILYIQSYFTYPLLLLSIQSFFYLKLTKPIFFKNDTMNPA